MRGTNSTRISTFWAVPASQSSPGLYSLRNKKRHCDTNMYRPLCHSLLSHTHTGVGSSVSCRYYASFCLSLSLSLFYLSIIFSFSLSRTQQAAYTFFISLTHTFTLNHDGEHNIDEGARDSSREVPEFRHQHSHSHLQSSRGNYIIVLPFYEVLAST